MGEGVASAVDLTTTLLTPIQSTINSSISGALPVVAGIAATLIGIGLVLKLVKKGTK